MAEKKTGTAKPAASAASKSASQTRKRKPAGTSGQPYTGVVADSLMTEPEIEQAFQVWSAGMPEPKTELNYTNPFTLLIAVLLSAQATDVGVNKATKDLFAVAETPEAMLALGEDGLKSYIRTIGLFNSKAVNALKTCEILIREHNSEVPRDRAALEALPGVGRKTANVVLNTAFGLPTIAVDTHIYRVSNRTGLAPGKTVLAVELALEERVPDRWQLHAHHWLILHGRYICKARKPECYRCQVIEWCHFPEKTPPPG